MPERGKVIGDDPKGAFRSPTSGGSLPLDSAIKAIGPVSSCQASVARMLPLKSGLQEFREYLGLEAKEVTPGKTPRTIVIGEPHGKGQSKSLTALETVKSVSFVELVAPLGSAEAEEKTSEGSASGQVLGKDVSIGSGELPLAGKQVERRMFPLKSLRYAEGGPSDEMKIQGLLPYGPEGKRVCFKEHSFSGCSLKDGVIPCCFEHPHTIMPPWCFSPEFHQLFLLKGGHVSLGGQVTIESMESLLDEGQRARVQELGRPAYEDLLGLTLNRRLAHLVKPHGEPISVRPIQQGKEVLLTKRLWGPESPFEIGSSGGLKVVEAFRVAFGSTDALMTGLMFDLDEEVLGSGLMCHIRALAGHLKPSKQIVPDSPENDAAALLLKGMLKSILEWDLSNVQPDSEAAALLELVSLAPEAGSGGLPDDFLKVAAPQCLSQVTSLTIKDVESGVPTFVLNIPEGQCGGDHGEELYGLGGKEGESLANRAFHPKTFCSEVMAVMVLAEPKGGTGRGTGDRHAYNLKLAGKITVQTLQRRLARWVDAGKGRVIIKRRASQGGLDRLGRWRKGKGRPVDMPQTIERIKAWAKRLDVVLDSSTPTRAAEELEAGSEAQAGGTPPETDKEEPAIEERTRAEDEEEWRSWHGAKCRSILGQTSPYTLKDYARLWRKAYLPLMEEAAEGALVERDHVRLLHFAAFFNNKWLCFAKEKLGQPRKALEAMTQTFREEFFQGEASELPSWEAIREAFIGKVSDEHLALLEEVVVEGADPIFLRGESKRGAKVRKGLTPQARQQLLKDSFVEVMAKRALLFGVWDQTAASILAEACDVSGTTSAAKTHDDGSPKLNEFLEALTRVCINCSDGDESVNAGIYSEDHTAQETTCPRVVAAKFIAEQSQFPCSPVLLTKHDIRHAFRWLGHVLRRVGLFASETDGFLTVYLTMIFGSKASPGCFEPLGDAVTQALMSEARPFPEDTGERHPQISRFVDDFLSQIAMSGKRAEDHIERLKRIIHSLFGKQGLNEEKEAREGEPGGQLSTLMHTFGVILDTLERLFKTPWSKLVKLRNLVAGYLNEEGTRMTYEQLTQVRGLAQTVTQCSTGLQRILMPRLDMGLSNAARAHSSGSESKIPKDALACFNLNGESEEQGEEMLRFELRLFLNLAHIRQGKLLQCTPEAMLSRGEREAWPGEENAGDVVDFEMDASKEALWLVDCSDGEQIQIVFTEAEKALFNAFELGHDATNINLFELWSEGIVAAQFGPKHPGKILRLFNDNACAQSWTDRSRHRHPRVEQTLVLLGVSEVLLRQTIWGARVETLRNIADMGTRVKRAGGLEEGLEALGKHYGWKHPLGTKVEPLKELREYGFNLASYCSMSPRWLPQVKALLSHVEAEGREGLVEKMTGVPMAEVMEALERTERKDQIPTFTFEGDFPKERVSPARKEITSQVKTTDTQYRRELHRSRERWGWEVGGDKFQSKMATKGMEIGESPEHTIAMCMEMRQKEINDLLYQTNLKFEPSQTGSAWKGSPAGRKTEEWQLKEGHRLSRPPRLGSGFSGLNPIGHAAKLSTGEMAFHAECQPRLSEHLEETFPEAESLKDYRELLKPQFQGAAEIDSYGVVCIPYAAANLHAKKTKDRDFGEQISHDLPDIIKNVGAAISHWENTVGASGALELFKQAMPDHHIKVLKVDAGKTRSPLTGELSPLRHIRLHVFAFRKDCFPDESMLDLTANESGPRSEFRSDLNKEEEGEGYITMPPEDQRALVYEYHRAGDGAAYMAQVSEPTEPGRGHGDFVTKVVDADRGRAPPWTTKGSIWVTRRLNGKVVVTRQANREGVRLYCLRGAPKECYQDLSYLGQSAIGNCIPQNVWDNLYVQILELYSKVQADGSTAQEKWISWRNSMGSSEAETYPTAGGKRKEIPIKGNDELRGRLRQVREEVANQGKKPKTVEDYCRHMSHWGYVAEEHGWDLDLSDIVDNNLVEAQERVLTWLAYEKEVHGLRASSLRGKLSGVRWWHLKRLKGNPFQNMDSVKSWLRDLQAIDGPANPKLPVPIALIRFLAVPLSVHKRHKDRALLSALLIGYWFLLRSAEYLANDKGDFDPGRALTWGDVFVKVRRDGAWGAVGPKEGLKSLLAGEQTMVTLRLYSSKNNLETCTRSLVAVPVGEDSDLCPVRNLLELYQSAEKNLKARPKGEEPVFRISDEEVLTRRRLADVLKAGAKACGIPQAAVSSHSLRRGGASAYSALGVADEAIQRFGRWTSEAYKAYVYPFAEVFQKALKAGLKATPTFERN